MVKFKKCYINLSRGDLTIMKIEKVESNSLSEAISESLNEVIMNADNPEEIDQDYIDECFERFYNGHGMGEEDCVLFLSEDNEWYYMVDTFNEWSDELYQEFSDYVIDCTATYSEEHVKQESNIISDISEEMFEHVYKHKMNCLTKELLEILELKKNAEGI